MLTNIYASRRDARNRINAAARGDIDAILGAVGDIDKTIKSQEDRRRKHAEEDRAKARQEEQDRIAAELAGFNREGAVAQRARQGVEQGQQDQDRAREQAMADAELARQANEKERAKQMAAAAPFVRQQFARAQADDARQVGKHRPVEDVVRQAAQGDSAFGALDDNDISSVLAQVRKTDDDLARATADIEAKRKAMAEQQEFENKQAASSGNRQWAALKAQQEAAKEAAAAREATQAASQANADRIYDLRRRLPTADLEGLEQKAGTLRMIDNLKTLKKGINTGLLQGKAKKLGKRVVDLPEYQAFYTQSGIVENLIAKGIEGGRMTDADRIAYHDFLANPEMPNAAFDATIMEAEKMIADSLYGTASSYNEGGWSVPPRYLPVEQDDGELRPDEIQWVK